MTPVQAFVTLVNEADVYLKAKGRIIPHAMLIGAQHIAEMSGSWHPDEMIWNAVPKTYERMQKLLKQEKIG
jgi:hypothetical protein